MLCKGPYSRLAEIGAPWSSSILLLLQHIPRDQNHEYYYYCFISKGLEQPIRSKCWANSGASRIREAGEPGLRPLLLKGKSPQSASGPRDQFCRGRGSSGLPWGHFSVTCGNAPLCSSYGAGNIFLEFFPNTQQVWGQDNSPVGGGPGAGARLLGLQLALGGA